jgi:hypothetical protein
VSYGELLSYPAFCSLRGGPFTRLPGCISTWFASVFLGGWFFQAFPQVFAVAGLVSFFSVLCVCACYSAGSYRRPWVSALT